MSAALDRERMQQALVLARASIGLSDPNPRVGCVIGRDDGTVLGTGHTQRAGEAHAEVMALRDAKANGADVRGSTAWVTLEPCAHHGRTPPCCDALSAAGVARVVIAIGDPFAAVSGRGIARLRAAGIRVDMAEQDLAARALELNVGFFSRVVRGRPWVRLKVATSLDGYIALPDGTSQWITSPASREDGHRFRARASAIVTGIGTVLADDPRLTVRPTPLAGQPIRVVVDSRWRTPRGARLLAEPGPIWVVGASENDAMEILKESPARCMSLPTGSGLVDLPLLLTRLSECGCNEVHLEAGPRLSGSFAAAGLVDEWLMYLAPSLLGAGHPMIRLPPAQSLEAAPRLLIGQVDRMGSDVRIRALSQDSAQGWSLPGLSELLTLALADGRPEIAT